MGFADAGHHWSCDQLGGAISQRGISLQEDSLAVAVALQPSGVRAHPDVKLDLVHRRGDRRLLCDAIQGRNAIVGDTNGLGLARLVEVLHSAPLLLHCSAIVGLRREMQQHQVYLVQVQELQVITQVLVGLVIVLGGARGRHLGGQEIALAVQASQGPTHAVLILVVVGRVDVVEPHLHSQLHCVLRDRRVVLPSTQGDQRHLHSVVQLDIGNGRTGTQGHAAGQLHDVRRAIRGRNENQGCT
mmetsp:Transcript_6839/g.14642  ORF Transcript_6839/g.14642 Transcript_6839/m.14642 type:complete len:243 (-) Transcript_6839:2-730(-)